MIYFVETQSYLKLWLVSTNIGILASTSRAHSVLLGSRKKLNSKIKLFHYNNKAFKSSQDGRGGAQKGRIEEGTSKIEKDDVEEVDGVSAACAAGLFILNLSKICQIYPGFFRVNICEVHLLHE